MLVLVLVEGVEAVAELHRSRPDRRVSSRIPEALMTRFQAVSAGRLQRIDSAWIALLAGNALPEAEGTSLLRDLHTLKGDARVLGLEDTSRLCQRLEDVVTAAHAANYRVTEDIDMVFTMAIQFLSMLVRKRGAPPAGVDLNGFLGQLDDVMGAWHAAVDKEKEEEGAITPRIPLRAPAPDVSQTGGFRVSATASALYLEHLRAPGGMKASVYDAWRVLVAGHLEAYRAPIRSTVTSHVTSAIELAATMGKRVNINVTAEEVRVCPETATAVEVVILHALRNAIDHGIEAPSVREAAGKPTTGEIQLAIRFDGSNVEVVVADDGGGVDVERIRQRALRLGILSTDEAARAGVADVLQCLFVPGFTTRDVASDISGRGIGLDAVRAACTGAGGTVAIESQIGVGMTLRAKVPDMRGTIDVLWFDGPRGTPRFAVPATFSVRPTFESEAVSLDQVLRLPLPSATEARSSIALVIQGNGTIISVQSVGEAVPALALRKCPTAADELTETVWVDGREVVLFRPDILAKTVASAPLVKGP